MKRLVFFVILLVSVGFWWFERENLSLLAVKHRQQQMAQWVEAYPVLSAAGFSAAYTILTAISFPGAAVLSLLAGSIFGLWIGSGMVLVAATVGSLGAFLLCRYLLSDWVRGRYKDKIALIDRGFHKDGAYYLFWLRLNPVVPFFLINLGMGLTQIPAWTFFWISFIGMAPGTWLYVNAGVRLGEIESASGLLSWPVVLSLIALGAVPLAIKRVLNRG
jgi:uncharacterized membrane protein YdjX (TVP38/TMEM64 family)